MAVLTRLKCNPFSLFSFGAEGGGLRRHLRKIKFRRVEKEKHYLGSVNKTQPFPSPKLMQFAPGKSEKLFLLLIVQIRLIFKDQGHDTFRWSRSMTADQSPLTLHLFYVAFFRFLCLITFFFNKISYVI